MMRHFVAFTLLLFVLEISVEASKNEVFAPADLCFVHTPRTCKAHCLESNCQNGRCKFVEVQGGHFLALRCVCEDCPGDQQRKEQLH
ncbi:unnamed protein product [Cylicocyclus nassatus]|uniref:Knottin scorpion toxin-like domain-containing protein n=1 Tax=Cylicocyclus nassatus TaxID=53992 RepID=A0AA36HB99_CYLNA|nr:unnamed protein product [Cylicocyclus nassatus]